MAANTPESLLQVMERKVLSLRRARVVATGASEQFKLDEEIAQLEKDIERHLVAYPTLRQARADQIGLEAFPAARQLIEFFKTIDFDPVDIGLRHRVNCNRTKSLGIFWENFKLDEDIHQYQVYFITACDTQMPQQFSERLLWEYIVEEEPEYPNFRTRQDRRLIIEDLPLKRNLKKSQDAFEAYIAERFDLRGSRDIASFLSGDVVNYEFDFVLLAFRTLEKDWKDFIPDYYRWIIKQFKQMAEGGPKFLLTFVHYSRDIHRPDCYTEHHDKLITALDAIEEEEPIAKHINRLKTVPIRDLEDWLQEVGVRNPSLRQRALQIALTELSETEKEQYTQKGTINMAYVDLVQDVIYRHLTR